MYCKVMKAKSDFASCFFSSSNENDFDTVISYWKCQLLMNLQSNSFPPRNKLNVTKGIHNFYGSVAVTCTWKLNFILSLIQLWLLFLFRTITVQCLVLIYMATNTKIQISGTGNPLHSYHSWVTPRNSFYIEDRRKPLSKDKMFLCLHAVSCRLTPESIAVALLL